MMRDGVALAILTLAAAMLVASCSTEGEVNFGELGCVAGGCQGTGNMGVAVGAGGSCTPDAGCAVSFKNDIFAGILDGSAGCTASGCHASGTANGNLELVKGSPGPAYTELLNYVLKKPAGPYLAPCNPAGSALLCNLVVDGKNPYPACGKVMPIGKKVTQAQFDQISEWIACGAPDN